jgi:hypothetical protein
LDGVDARTLKMWGARMRPRVSAIAAAASGEYLVDLGDSPGERLDCVLGVADE